MNVHAAISGKGTTVEYFVTREMEHGKAGLGLCKLFPVPYANFIAMNMTNPKGTHTPDNLHAPQTRKQDLT